MCFIALIGLCVRLSRDIVYKDLNTIHRIFLRIGFKTVSETTHWNALNKCNLNSQFSRPCFLCQWFYLVRTPVLEPSLGFLWCSEKTFAKTHIYSNIHVYIYFNNCKRNMNLLPVMHHWIKIVGLTKCCCVEVTFLLKVMFFA